MARTLCYVFGAIFVVVGILGFVMNPVLGVFHANTMHSLIHLVSGVVLLAVALWASSSSSLVLKIFGIVYAIVAILGFIMPGDILGLLDNTLADNLLHTVLALVFLWGGFMAKGSSSTMSSSSMGGGM